MKHRLNAYYYCIYKYKPFYYRPTGVMKIRPTIPRQTKGGHSDTSHAVTASTHEEANELFIKAAHRLLDVNHWNQLAGFLSAVFILTDKGGSEVKRLAEAGDYFKIDIPGPGLESGEGFDWVEIEKVEDLPDPLSESESLAITVSPAPNPKQAGSDAAHFFSDEASSTFMVERNGNTVTASVHGRNEIPNTEIEDNKDKIRNAIVALGAITGLSKVQWKNLVTGLLKS